MDKTMAEIQSLKPVGLREAWPDEARHFTPWLATHIDRLGGKLDLRLEAVQVEVTLPGAGRVDICAKQAETGARVVIENQLEQSDDSHCLRLLGYAANAEASILVWVAHSFSTYHRRILEWLNEADTIDVYAVTVRAYRVGEALAADFQTVVEPPQSRPGPSPGARKTTTTLYGEFYRPLVARLRRNGVQPVGEGWVAGPVADIPDRALRCHLRHGCGRTKGQSVLEIQRNRPPGWVPGPTPAPRGARREGGGHLIVAR